MSELKVGLLGGGSWGTTVASLIARNASVKLRARNPLVASEINGHHRNTRYLPSASIWPQKGPVTIEVPSSITLKSVKTDLSLDRDIISFPIYISILVFLVLIN